MGKEGRKSGVVREGRLSGEVEVVSDELSPATRSSGKNGVRWDGLAILFIRL